MIVTTLMMRRTPLDVLTLSGTATDIAFALGRARREKVRVRAAYWNRLLAKLFRGRRDKLKKLEKSFLAEATKAAPRYVEEIRALAAGAGVPFADAFRLNLTELKAYAEKCTTVALPFRAEGGDRVLIAHNEDWEPAQNDVFVLRGKMPDVSYAILTYDGYIPGLSSGVNSYGLCHAVNYVLAKDIRGALPRAFITRFLVTARNTEECLAWIRSHRRAFGQSIHLAEKDRYTGIEVTAKKVFVRRAAFPVVHANHYLTRAALPFAGKPSANSLKRQAVGAARARALWTARKKPLTKAQAASLATTVLSDRSGYPYCLWREADSKLETSATVASVLLDTDSRTLTVYRDRPDSSRPIKVGV